MLHVQVLLHEHDGRIALVHVGVLHELWPPGAGHAALWDVRQRIRALPRSEAARRCSPASLGVQLLGELALAPERAVRCVVDAQQVLRRHLVHDQQELREARRRTALGVRPPHQLVEAFALVGRELRDAAEDFLQRMELHLARVVNVRREDGAQELHIIRAIAALLDDLHLALDVLLVPQVEALPHESQKALEPELFLREGAGQPLDDFRLALDAHDGLWHKVPDHLPHFQRVQPPVVIDVVLVPDLL
mmetsp:Transcript_97289/g.279547  ORF Transcript_97289/g.279547 Transcript_97289/m.279547 type:complete len:248 (+) Transcript_97289:118-861(+)